MMEALMMYSVYVCMYVCTGFLGNKSIMGVALF